MESFGASVVTVENRPLRHNIEMVMLLQMLLFLTITILSIFAIIFVIVIVILQIASNSKVCNAGA